MVDAALRLFSESAYEAVQMDDVARAAGVAKPTLYRYFHTKEELFLEGLEKALGDQETDAEEAASGAASAREGLATVIRCVIASLGRCTAAIRAFDGADARLGERGRAVIRRRVKQIRKTIASLIARGVATGEFRPLEPDLVAVALLGAMRMTAAHTTERQQAGAARMLADLIENGLAPEAPVVGAEPSLLDETVVPS
jgi:AcrR family transcriptional regulator